MDSNNPQHWKDLNFKDKASYTTALVAFVLGFILLFAGFFINPAGEIDTSVLAGFGTCLIYTASIFGIAMYIKNSMIDVRADIATKVQEELENLYKGAESYTPSNNNSQEFFVDNLGNGQPQSPLNNTETE